MRGTRNRGRTVAAALLAGGLLLTGCAGAGGSDSSTAQSDTGAQKPAYEGPGAGAAGAEKAPDAKPGSRAPAQVARQHVIRTADMAVEVDDTVKALAAARRTATAAGGHVEGETTERIDDTHVTSRVVLRVPEERYDSVLTELAGSGKLLSRKAEAKDVTGQVVDVESRIATQRASVARVRALMDKATALSDVVTLEAELSRRQADLESLLAQQAALKDSTTLATITLELRQPDAVAADEDDRPGFLDALDGGWSALVAALAWTLVVLAALAPWLLLLLVGFVLWRRVIRPRLPRRPKPQPQPGGPYPAGPYQPWPRPDARTASGVPGPARPAEGPGASEAPDEEETAP
ncbi:DUF4349 domain-containing protein [Streptomyces sp. NPDC048659]|uniref:DUF4349 domain-containing protein n=1 Tax=Streptomyces sp. NPDC048659 TaxID=3155489 RepID=UPI003418DAD7